MSELLSPEEQREYFLKNQGLVHYIVNSFGISYSDHDDIASIGNIGLEKAIKTFDKSKKIHFATYAIPVIKNEIRTHFRKEKKHEKVISLYSPNPISNEDGDNELMLIDSLQGSTAPFTDRIEDGSIGSELICIILNRLEQKEKLTLLYRIAGVEQNKISRTLNFSQSYASRLITRARKHLKHFFETKAQYRKVFKMAITGDLYNLSFSSNDVKNFNKIFSSFLLNLGNTDDLPEFRVICTNKRITLQVPADPTSFAFIAKIIQEIDDFSISYTLINSDLNNNNNATLSEPEEHKPELGKKAEPETELKSEQHEPDLGQKPEPETAPKPEQYEPDLGQKPEPEAAPKPEQYEPDLGQKPEPETAPKTEAVPKTASDASDNSSPAKSTTDTSVRKRVSRSNQVQNYILSLDEFTVKDILAFFPEISSKIIYASIARLNKKHLVESISWGKYKVIKN